jgi:hypothetical protein
VANQNFDMLTFSWTLEDVDAYLLKLVERIDNSYEKEDYNNKVPVIYVLALPDYVDENDLYANGVKLELLNQKIDEIQDLYGKDLVQIVHYDSHKKFADIGINNIDRKWYYMRVASLSLNKDTYNISSPWSNQIVA